jgi:ribose 5-phosphate isomerase B
MKISIGSDHRGIQQRNAVARAIESSGNTVDDCGTHTEESCDYPDIAAEVARRVGAGKSERGVLLCGTGIGVSIAANKVNGVRAALCCDEAAALLSRQHNDANILCLAASKSNEELESIVKAWLAEDFEAGRHERRVNKMMALED